MRIEPVEWTSGGERVAGLLHVPEGEGPFAGIVLCHGFAGVKELLLPAFAERFAAAGFCSLTFDYRGFGASGGDRGRIIAEHQITDVLSALAFLQRGSRIDAARIGLWGTSLGGANAIVAASRSPLVGCLAVQLTFGSGERVVTGAMSDQEKERFSATLQRMASKRDQTGKEMMVPLQKVLTDPQSAAFYERYVDSFDALRIKVPFLTVLETLRFEPERWLPELTIPIHIVGAGKDAVNPPEESHRLYAAARDPKALLMIEEATHYDLYEDPLLERVTRAQIRWFRSHLGTRVA